MKWILLALQLLPGILGAVKSVEDAVGAGNGKAKKQLVMDAIQAGAAAAQQIPQEHVQAVSVLVDRTVDVLNASEVFKTSEGK